MALSLDSKYSKRIYEMMAQYRNLGELKIDVTELKRRLSLYNEKSGVEQYKNWADFERRILLVAQNEMNEKTDLRVTYKTIKQGRRISTLHFYIKAEGRQMAIDYKDETAAVFGRLVTEFKLRKDQANAVIANCSGPDIAKRLYEIRLMYSDSKIKNLGAYTAKVFGI